MTLVDAVVALLRAHGIPHAIIGAAALGAHGIARATADIDLLTTDTRSLTASTWDLLPADCAVDVRRGDADDPLGGVVRVTRSGALDVDLVIGKFEWMSACVERAASLAPAGVPVVQLADLILLKLYAGGPQDGWDITQMLALPAGPAAIEDVEARLSPLPRSSAQLWTRIRTESGL